MASLGYQSKSIIGGVSTRPYALREDGHMADTSNETYTDADETITTENCMLSPKFGLCKRPGSTYVQTVESNIVLSGAVFIPLLTGDSERVVVGMAASSWHVYGKDGIKYPVTFFPSSASSAATAVSKYTAAGATFDTHTLSTTTVGDVTFIADSDVIPRMKTDTWAGYTETANDGDGSGTVTVTNDDVFAIWIKQIPATKEIAFTTKAGFYEERGGTVYKYLAKFGSKTAGTDTNDLDLNASDILRPLQLGGWISMNAGGSNASPTNHIIAAHLGYYLAIHREEGDDGGNFIVQATNLDSADYTSGNSDRKNDGGEVVLGRHVNQNAGTLSSVFIDRSTHSLGANSFIVTHKEVDSISELPPYSWTDHTVKVGSRDVNSGFYMRFVDDSTTPPTFSNNAGGHAANKPEITATTKASQNGHWEEYCGAGVEQEIDGSTMPLLFVTRPDNSYALMEARESFVINGDDAGVTFVGGADDYFTVDNFDAGFNDSSVCSPLVADDSIQFSVGGSNFPSELSVDTKYYIRSAVYTGGAWRYQLKTSKVATTAISVTAGSAGSCEIKLTTYNDFAWQKRVAGDDETNAAPGFIDTGIKGLFNFQDRLGMVTAGQVIFSGTGDYFNFFKTTVRDLDASDPFAAAPNLEDGDALKYAVPFERDLILVSTRAQYTLKTTAGLSPSTAAIVNAARIETDALGGMPEVVGDNLFVSSQQEDASTVTSLQNADQASTKLRAFDTSVNTPGYLPAGPRRMVGNQKHNMLFLLDDTASTNLYVYSWLDSKDGRLQSAWNKWTFGTDYTIKDILVHGDRLYLLATTNSMVVLESIDLDLTTEDSLLNAALTSNFKNCLIDHKTHNTAATADESGTHGGIYSETLASGDTKIKLKWRLTDNNKENVVVVKSDGTIYEYGDGSANTISVTISQSGDTLSHGTTTSSTMTEIVVNDVDLTSSDYYVGLKYTMNAVYGPFIPSTQDAPLSGRKIFAKTGRVTYSRANEFKLLLKQDTTYTQTVTAATSTASLAGDTMFSVRKHLPDMEFVVRNEKPWNAMFQVLKYDFSVQEIAGG